MVRWEYLSVDFESHPMNQGYGGLQHYNFVSYIEASRLGLEPDRDVQYMETVLDIVGNNGWELISLVPIFIEDHDTLKRTKFLKAVFKRPKDSDD